MTLARSLSLPLFAALLSLTACATGPRIRVEAAPGADLASYKTYSFMEPFGTDRSGYGTPLSRYVKDAVRSQLDTRGYRYVDKDGELLVNAGAKVADKTSVSTMPVSDPFFSYRYGRYRYWTGYREEVVVNQYTEGTLVIDLVDRARGEMVWSGAAIGRVTAKVRENLGPAVTGAVNDIFAKLP